MCEEKKQKRRNHVKIFLYFHALHIRKEKV